MAGQAARRPFFVHPHCLGRPRFRARQHMTPRAPYVPDCPELHGGDHCGCAHPPFPARPTKEDLVRSFSYWIRQHNTRQLSVWSWACRSGGASNEPAGEWEPGTAATDGPTIVQPGWHAPATRWIIVGAMARVRVRGVAGGWLPGVIANNRFSYQKTLVKKGTMPQPSRPL